MDKTEALNIAFLAGVIIVLVAASVYVNVFWDDGEEEEDEEEEEDVEGMYDVVEAAAVGEPADEDAGSVIQTRSKNGPPGPCLTFSPPSDLRRYQTGNVPS